ncbi:MAG: hypothetical protein AB7R55_07300 [Gemmatimonadales bacterium]
MTATLASQDRVARPIPSNGPRRDAAEPDSLASRLSEAGHPPVRETPSGVVIALGNRGLHHATAHLAGDRIGIEVTIASGKPLPAPVRLALERYLGLGASGFRRLSWRLDDESGRQSAVLASCAPSADVTPIREAIEGLGLACDHLGPAARALAAESVARRYLTHLTPNEGAA